MGLRGGEGVLEGGGKVENMYIILKRVVCGREESSDVRGG